MKNRYKLVIYPFLDNEKIIYFDRLTKKKIDMIVNAEYYLLFTYHDFLRSYMIINCNFELNGLENKLQPYLERV